MLAALAGFVVFKRWNKPGMQPVKAENELTSHPIESDFEESDEESDFEESEFEEEDFKESDLEQDNNEEEDFLLPDDM
jgi:hypothetical protein